MPGEKARQAFEQLKQAYNELRDPAKMVSRLLLLLPVLCTIVSSICAATCRVAGWSANIGPSTWQRLDNS
jgi:hypothetical protein